jgi:predicted Fe-Mo cluster-binding NifX family protein
MKIAIATEGSTVAPHFGRCPEYTLYNVKDGSVTDKTVIPNPGHEPGFLPEYLSKLGVSCIIAGGMGMRAKNLFAGKSIQTVVGATGLVDEVAEAFAAGTLKGGESLCEHGQGEHPGNHNCGHHEDHIDGHECEKK